ncbi:MAG: type III pantothenate kinase [Acidobacteria bacterium]|nr:type III pantothenate kinase [Acidobacteriota bacterium]
MLLVIDVGNTNTVLGVYEGERLAAHWRLVTAHQQTVDEYGILARNLLQLAGLDAGKIDGVIISSVVPQLDHTLADMVARYFKLAPLFVEPGIKTGIRIHYENPQEVGADRIANAVAAYEKYGGPAIIVDFGTAITFDALSDKGDYLGGVITPGLGIASDALFQRTARLPRVALAEPEKLIGTNTVGSIQSGLFYGSLAMVDGVLDRLKAELGEKARVIATGGQASLLAGASRHIELVDEFLTLDGLRLLYLRNADKTAPLQPRGRKAPDAGRTVSAAAGPAKKKPKPRR